MYYYKYCSCILPINLSFVYNRDFNLMLDCVVQSSFMNVARFMGYIHRLYLTIFMAKS